MAIGTPLLPGDSSVDQIFQVWRTFGGLPQRSASTGAGVAAKSSAAAAPPRTPMQRSSLRARLSTLLEEPLLELLEAALRTDPHERATAEDLIRMPYFDEIPELVAGTELESLYDWSTGAGAAAPPAAAAARAVSLQASELDLPASKPTQAEVVADSLLPPPSAPAPSATADWQAYALAAAAAAAAARRKDDAALAVRPAAVVSPVLRMQAAVEALTVPEPGGGGGGGAATAIGQLGGEDTGDTFPGGSRCTVRMEEQQQQAGGGSVGKEHDQDYEWGFRGGEGRESGELGQSALALLQGSNGADPRVGNSKAPTGAMHRVSSLPVLDKVGAENPRNDLRRTTSMGLAARRQLAGGGGGGRQMRARTAGRAGAALSLCNFLAQGQVPSGLSNWCESHWELATASESDAAPMQEAATGSVTQGRPWATSSNTTATIPEDEPLVEPQTQQQRLSQLGGPSPDAAELPVKCLLPSLSPATAATAAATAAAATATAAAAAAAAAAEVRALCGRRQRQLPSACEATAPSAPADAFLGRGGTTRSDRGPAVLDGGGGGAASAAMAAAVSRGDDVVASAAAADVVLSGTGLTMPLAPKECDVVGGDAGGGGGDGGAGDGRDMTPICVRSSLVNSAPDVLSPDAGLGVDGGEHRAPVHKVLSVVGREAGGPTCAADVDGGGGGGCGSLRLPPAEAEAVAEIEASSASPARRDGGRWAGGSETADSAAAAPAVNSASRSDDPRPCKPSVYDDSTATYDVTTGDGPLDAVDTCISIFTAGIVSQSHGVCANKAPEEAGGAGQRGKAGKGWQQDGGREKQRAPQRECERAVQDP
ncbi:hypothetical protein PLESTF_001233700 [Pleodorina starrii]|nr:hypothetical protein PLESTF_001233700 [Pleodorina starrii]